MVKFTLGVKDNILMIFVTESLQQDHQYAFIGRLLEEFIAKEKFNGSRAQYGMGKLEGDIGAFDYDIDHTGF
jgi:hypothetical protein